MGENEGEGIVFVVPMEGRCFRGQGISGGDYFVSLEYANNPGHATRESFGILFVRDDNVLGGTTVGGGTLRRELAWGKLVEIPREEREAREAASVPWAIAVGGMSPEEYAEAQAKRRKHR
ncbi:MAG: hypothetical protein KGL54_15105 [Sphingomonadales bacterium]|nr:hypothetical protein [Sphingomonadales bacterium]